MNVRPKNSEYWTFKESAELTENIRAMPHLHHVAVVHSVLMFQQLSYFWYMEKSNREEAKTLSPSVVTLYWSASLSQKKTPPNKTNKKPQTPNHLHSFLEGNKDLSWRYRASLRLTDLTWHSRSVEFGRVNRAVTLNSRIFAIIHPLIISKELLVALHTENSAF